jgi:guanylate cyclase
VVYKLTFKNEAFDQSNSHASLSSGVHTAAMNDLQISSEVFFELFPFHIVFKRNLEIISIGEGLKTAMKNVLGETVKDLFNLNRPMMAFTWENVCYYKIHSYSLIIY